MAHFGNWKLLCRASWELSKSAPCSESSKLYLQHLLSYKYLRFQVKVINAFS